MRSVREPAVALTTTVDFIQPPPDCGPRRHWISIAPSSIVKGGLPRFLRDPESVWSIFPVRANRCAVYADQDQIDQIVLGLAGSLRNAMPAICARSLSGSN